MRILLPILFLSLLIPRGLRAEELRDDAFENLKSPLSTDAKYVLLAGAGLTGFLLAYRGQTVDPLQDYYAREKPQGEWSKYGDIAGQNLPNALYFLGMFAYGRAEDDPTAIRDASAMLQASLYSGFATNVIKYSVQEPRPYDPSTKNSFPSGHTTTAFAFASYVGCRHSLPWGIASYALATFVGLSRINDNAHYLHDVTAGAAIGASYGLGICLTQRKNDGEATRVAGGSWRLAPHAGGTRSGMSLIHEFAF